MARTLSVSDSVVVAASAVDIYTCLSDPTRMGRWSEENVGATVVGDWSDGARVGLQFDGHNRWSPKLRGRWMPVRRWTTRCEVTAADAPRTFAFRAWLPVLGDRGRPRVAVPLALWEYHLDPVAEVDEPDRGTRVTHTWTLEMPERAVRWSRPLSPYLLAQDVTVDAFQARNIAFTLSRLKADLERTRA